MTITDKALSTLTYSSASSASSAGFPKIMQLVGGIAYWIDDDQTIDEKDASRAVIDAAEDFGKKYVDVRVYKALRSEDYRNILKKIGEQGPEQMSFRKSDIESRLTGQEKRKFHNFLQKMKALNVLRQGKPAANMCLASAWSDCMSGFRPSGPGRTPVFQEDTPVTSRQDLFPCGSG